MITQEKPIIIVGAERSGTTLLMAMLGCHPRIAIPEVAWYYPRFHPYLHTYGDLSREVNFRTLAEEMVHGLKTPYWGVEVNPRTIVDEILSTVRERSFAGLYCAMFEWYARVAGGKPRWGEKTPHNLFYIGPISNDFPSAQFLHVTRDGRDASADYIKSAFGPTNIFCAAESWKLCENAARVWRERLPADRWMDVKYETLVTAPEETLRSVCGFLGETYVPAMLDFPGSAIARARGATRDHKPLGHAASGRYIGIYKELLSLRDQRIFAAVAGPEMKRAGYSLDVDPVEIGEEEASLFRELDARIRAATLDAPEGHIVYESYNDWLVDQREERRRRGLFSEKDVPEGFPLGHPHEEMIMGQRAWRAWKERFCVKRQYTGKAAL